MKLYETWRRLIVTLQDEQTISRSGLFNAGYYLNQIPEGLGRKNPIENYVTIGEALGLKPSSEFDPSYYRAANPDVARSGRSLFAHYLRFGRTEGRLAKDTTSLPPPELKPAISKSRLDRKRQNVIVILHELSRTGAPILGLNIIQHLCDEHDVNVIGVSLRDGDLTDYLAAFATVPIIRDWSIERWGAEAKELANWLMETYSPAYVIANGTGTFALGLAFHRRGARVVGLVHEFGMFLQGSPGVAEFFAEGDELVFSVELVRASISDHFPVVHVRRTCLVPQGRSAIPGASRIDSASTALAAVRDQASFVVLGAGSIDWRKGVDLFLATAASLHRRYPASEARFVWVGDAFIHDAGAKSYLLEQMKRTHLGNRFALFPATPDLDDVYRSVDALFISSRLDPLPNVAIDAASLGLPVVCFDKATGFAEILQRDEVAKALVVPHLDLGAAADVIYRLETDISWRRQVAQATASLSAATFNMESYVRRIHEIGMKLSPRKLSIPKQRSRTVR